MKNFELQQIDLQIINALQIEPRAPWTVLSGILGLDSVTLARRWERIISSGCAWSVAMEDAGHRGSTAIVEVQCHPGQVLRTAEQASLDRDIISIDLTSGSRDIVMTLTARDDDELAEYILTRLGTLPGVRSTRTYILNSILKLGANWTVQALSAAQVNSIPRFRPPRAAAAKVVPEQLATGIVRVLEKDVRASNTELSRELGISGQRASDALATLRMQQALDLRIHVAQQYSNWPAVTWYFLQVPVASLVEGDDAWLAMPEIQFAGVAFGEFNLIVALTSRSRADALRLEAVLESRIPGARVADRSTVIRVHKHLGHLLAPSGRATGQIVSLVRG